ncbi:hypothetical protein CEUSTIGMA_g6854.t1 [Chlamydomonas eustigma]|uniref:RING-type domain-containing protein n=1 Tax=Chlamydomonas eustigma TaxID=1157962 RepID=A0A250X8K9_9CHLO|nr:hypothetical protein CEUSTIGMA_g6854.t1 [Chlamydomonas eustigma]|eukprot:GAX79413.1 hypothetical protein CEUSTIGMA_g6854.t1 [Chlamydomonas eustigma]
MEAHAEEDDTTDTDDSWETATSDEDTKMDDADSISLAHTRGAGNHGCSHYRRRCMLVAPCCNEAFWCRHCHNAIKCDNEQEPRKKHVLDRKAIREVVCALCSKRQPAAATCNACGVSFGRYSCLQCNFFDDDLSKKQYHCEDCGICRVGGRQHYFHCSTCNCCYAISLRNSHVCIENSMHHNCPVCFEFLFESIKPINVMPCGHTIHQACLKELAVHQSYTCPVCSKTYMNMNRMWRHMDTLVAETPMPEEHRGIQVALLCNDCNRRFEAPFHVVGHKCSGCGGYNTKRV